SSTQIHQPPSLAFDLFCFNTAATTEIYTLSLHDALPIFSLTGRNEIREAGDVLFHRPFFGGYHAKGTPLRAASRQKANGVILVRSEEHTSELQSRGHLVCRLLLEKKK